MGKVETFLEVNPSRHAKNAMLNLPYESEPVAQFYADSNRTDASRSNVNAHIIVRSDQGMVFEMFGLDEGTNIWFPSVRARPSGSFLHFAFRRCVSSVRACNHKLAHLLHTAWLGFNTFVPHCGGPDGLSSISGSPESSQAL